MTNNFSNNDLYLKSTGPVTSNNPTSGVGYAAGAGSAITQASFTLSGVAVADSVGNCTCTAPATNLTVGMAIAVTGSLTGSETGISTSTTYYIIATNGSTTFQLSASIGGSAITTTAGTTTGLTFTINGSSTSSTGVYCNTVSGQITTVALTTAAGAEEVFVVNNSSVLATDVIAVTTTYAGAGTPAVTTYNLANGSFKVVITNLNASTALNAAMTINFAVVRVAIS